MSQVAGWGFSCSIHTEITCRQRAAPEFLGLTSRVSKYTCLEHLHLQSQGLGASHLQSQGLGAPHFRVRGSGLHTSESETRGSTLQNQRLGAPNFRVRDSGLHTFRVRDLGLHTSESELRVPHFRVRTQGSTLQNQRFIAQGLEF